MKKAFLVAMVLIAVFGLFAEATDFLRLRGSEFTPEVLSEVSRRNELVRGPSFNFPSSPYNLPAGTERFYEDVPWVKDFTEYLNPGSYTDVNNLVILTSNPEHFIITFPDPINRRIIRFEPRPQHWYGSELIAVSLYEDYLDGTHSEPFTAILRINVTSVPDAPIVANLPVANTFYVEEDHVITVDFHDYVTCIDSAPTNYDLFVTQTEISFPYSINVSQAPGINGNLVTFSPRDNFNGIKNFIVTAVDRQSNAFTAVQITVVVTPTNDPPTIDSYLPANLNLSVNQNDTVNFSVAVSDLDMNTLTHSWVLSGSLYGVPFSTELSTTTTLNHLFDIPGVYSLTYTVSDGLESDSVTWNISVSPVGPLFNPWGGVFDHGISVSLMPPAGFEGATIYYTTDGTIPTTGSPVYMQPIDIPALGNIENFVTIKAFFTHPSFPPSQVVSFNYRITGRVADPVFNPVGGLYYSLTNVELSCPNLGASIYYTTDGSDPVPGAPGTSLYLAPIPVPTQSSMTIKAIATRADWINSNIITHQYNVTGVVTINSHTMNPSPPAEGTWLTVEPGDFIPLLIQGVTMTPPSATLYYTLDNSVPGPSNPNSFIYTTGTVIELTCPTWIRIRAYNPDWLPSQTFTYFYDVRTRTSILPFANGSIFDPAPGYSISGHLVTISTSTNPAGAAVYYTIDGTDPTENPALLYTGPFMVHQTTLVKVLAQYPDICPSEIYSGMFTITGQVDTPTFSPTPGSYQTAINVSISTLLDGTTIYYTLNGADPLPASESPDSYLYTGAVNLPAGQHHIRARAYKEHWTPSLIRDGYYSVGVLPAPTFNLPAGTYPDPITVRLSVPSVPDASIHYTTDGTEPTTASTFYDDAIGIPVGHQQAMTIRAIAWKVGWQTSSISQRTYNVTGTVAAPVFNPGGGSYAAAQNVIITTGTAGATIRYTLDGTEPSLVNGFDYTGPVNIATSSTLRARAYLTNWRESAITTADYTIFGIVAAPVFTPGAGTYTSPVNVYISVNPPDASIYYTTDGSAPSEVNGTLYVAGTPINISANTLLRAIAVKAGWNSSAIVSAQYNITGQVAMPVFSPGAGQYASAQTVTISTITPGATIVYTTDGTEPSLVNGSVYLTPITISNNTTLKAYAYLADWLDSNVNTAVYVINGFVSTPVFSPAGGYYNADQSVIITAIPADATIIYTTDGSAPAVGNGTIYAGAIPVTEYTRIRAIAIKAGWLNSAEASAEYFFVVRNPQLSLSSGAYPNAQSLSLTVNTPGATIIYTTDGTDPAVGNGIVYDGNPITIAVNTNIKVIAVKNNWISSSIIQAEYIINGPVSTPVFSVPGGNYYDELMVAINTFPADATIYYTTDGSEPSDLNGFVYVAPIPVTQITTLKAKAYRNNWMPSNVATAMYELYVRPVGFNPNQGSYNSAQNIALSTPTALASVYYTTDGTDPDNITGTLYSGLINLTDDTLVKAIAYRTGWHPSVITAANYIIDIPLPVVAAPIFSLPSGVYDSSQVVMISVTTPGATIRYTLDGTNPDAVNGMDYTGPITVNATTQIRAYAYLAGWGDSPISLANYVIILPVQTVATPVFTPVGGVYNNSVDVVITTTTPLADIYYTLDGTEPSNVNGTLYAGPITITSTTTVKAIAYRTGWENSLINNASYVIFIPVETVQTPQLFPAPGTYTYSPTITIVTTTPGSLIIYTLDGSDPSLTNGIPYLAPFALSLDSTTTVKAIAFKDGWNNSQMAAGTYIVTGSVADVTFLPAGGTYTSMQTVVLSTATEGATVRYTTDGSDPTALSPVYNAGIALAHNTITTIKARAFKSGWAPSAITEETYNITGQVTISDPVFSLPSGTYNTAQTVSIVGAYFPADASVHYTLDGTTPTTDSPVYTTPFDIALNSSVTITVRGFKTDWIPSPVYTATYTVTGQVQLPAVVFTPAPGTYQTAQAVTISPALLPADAVLRYTLDGSEPTELSPAYAGAINLGLNTTTTIKVKAFKADWTPSDTATGIYIITGQVVYNTPVFSPAPGIYTTAQNITINSINPADAVVYYTLDGSEPTTASTQYTAAIPLPLNSSLTIKTKAFKADWTPSETHTGFYTTTGNVTIQLPVFDPAPGLYTSPQMVTINSNTAPAGATLHYTLDGSDPSQSSPVYTAPIPVNTGQTVNIRVRAYSTNWLPSDIHSGSYTVTGQVSIADPVFTPAGGIFTSPQVVVLNTITNPVGATLRYTTDGSEPTASSPIYTTGIPVNQSMTIKVKAYKTDWIPSITHTATYSITGQVTISSPIFNIPAGIYTSAQTVSVIGSPNPTDAIIRYSTDGSDPTETSPIYASPFNIALNSSLTIKLRAFKTDWIPSPVYTATYTVTGQVQLPAVVFTPAPGTYQTAQNITLNTATVPTGTTLRYTLDGTEPNDLSPAYTNPIALGLNTNTTIKVKAFKQDWIPSSTASGTYVITGQIVFNAPVFDPPQGIYYVAQTVSINGTVPSNAVIRYTTNGTDPTEASPVYSAQIPITQGTTTLKVRAFLANWTPSAVQTAVYQVTGQVAMTSPYFSPAPGTYQTPQNVTINTTTVPSGASIYYTMDGTVPTQSSYMYHGDPINVPLDTSITFRARAFLNNWLPSEVAIATYTITGQVAITGSPVFNPAPGTYTNPISVSVNPQTHPLGATLRYTTDGTDPNETSPIYTSAIQLATDSNTTIKVRGYATGWVPSEVYTATYVVTGTVSFSGPLFDPPAGNYTTAQMVSIIANIYPSGATLRYTTDGSEPTATSDIYSTPINIPLNTFGFQIKAKAFHPNWVDSPVISSIYNVTGQVTLATPAISPAAGTYTAAQTISMAPAVLPTTADIRYTMDGSEPTLTSPAYTGSFILPINSQTTIKLKGFAQDWISSPTVTAIYNITGTVADPIFSIDGGIYAEAFDLEITTPTAGAEIRYTTDGSEPDQSSMLYTGPINIADMTQNLGIRAKAFKTDWVSSQTIGETYSVLLLPINIRAYSYSGYIRVLWNSPLASRALDGFNLYRRGSGEASFTKVNTSGLINTFDGGFYYYDDYVIQVNSSYSYYVTAVYNGMESLGSETTTIEYQTGDLVINDSSHVYPNPAVNSCRIKLVLSRNDNVQVSVTIFDFAGKQIRSLSVPATNTNLIEVLWDLKNSGGVKVARGTYFARVVAVDGANRSEKILKIAVQ